MYVVMVVLLTVILPLGSVIAESMLSAGAMPVMLLVGKWFVFWAGGVRLLLAGFKQFLQPGFTAHRIFRMTSDEALPVVRELGIANISLGVVGASSILAPGFVLPVAIAGAVFYGMAGLQHVALKEKSGNETLAMATDLFVALALAAYVLSVWKG